MLCVLNEIGKVLMQVKV